MDKLKSLNLNAIEKRITKTVTTKEALRDVTPFDFKSSTPKIIVKKDPKADQLYYFDKNKISYRVIGSLEPDTFNSLIEFIQNSDFAIEQITDNL